MGNSSSNRENSRLNGNANVDLVIFQGIRSALNAK